MNEFDIKAAGWDQNRMHWDRSEAIADKIISNIPLNNSMTALEYGAGTGITSFLLKDHLKKITLMDNSAEMVRIMNEKIKETGADNLEVLSFDLEHEDYMKQKFDLILTQMVLHHVNNVENILGKFQLMLNPGGYLAIADLYPEDGTFHGDGFNGHKGFDIELLSEQIAQRGFENISHEQCFVINKKVSETETKHFEVFLLTAIRK